MHERTADTIVHTHPFYEAPEKLFARQSPGIGRRMTNSAIQRADCPNTSPEIVSAVGDVASGFDEGRRADLPARTATTMMLPSLQVQNPGSGH
jgi:hypothetical protein